MPTAPQNLPSATWPRKMVREFTELQGIVGGLYARRAQGESR